MHFVELVHPIRTIVVHLAIVAVDFRRSLTRRGMLYTAKAGLQRVLSSEGARSLRPSQDSSRLEHPFDSENGVQTGGLIPGREMTTGYRHDMDNVGYYGVQPSVFRAACARWLSTLPSDESIRNYTFVDLGAGKGRALLLASELPFREIIGVEFSRELVKIAESNISLPAKNTRTCNDIRVVCQDVVDFTWPQAPLVIYLYNPFGHRVLRKLLVRLREAGVARSFPVDILYVNPDCEFVLSRQPGLELLWKELIPMSESDRAADVYAKRAEWVSAYRLQPAP